MERRQHTVDQGGARWPVSVFALCDVRASHWFLGAMNTTLPTPAIIIHAPVDK